MAFSVECVPIQKAAGTEYYQIIVWVFCFSAAFYAEELFWDFWGYSLCF